MPDPKPPARPPAPSFTTSRRPTCRIPPSACCTCRVFLAKARKHLAGELPPSYQRNFTKGFDGFLCLHLGVDPLVVVAAVRDAKDEDDLTDPQRKILPAPVNPAKRNRQVVQMGMSEMGREALAATKKKMAIEDREDLRSFADLIEYDEERLA